MILVIGVTRRATTDAVGDPNKHGMYIATPPIVPLAPLPTLTAFPFYTGVTSMTPSVPATDTGFSHRANLLPDVASTARVLPTPGYSESLYWRGPHPATSIRVGTAVPVSRWSYIPELPESTSHGSPGTPLRSTG